MARTKAEAKKRESDASMPPPVKKIKKDRKPRRYKPGTVAKREIVKLQRNTDYVVPKAPLDRLRGEIVHYITQDI